MCIVTFRPHTLVHKKAVGGSYSANGDWVKGSSEGTGHIPCRYEPNGKAETIRLPDGTDYQYHYTIYLSPDAGISPVFGDVVELFDKLGTSIGEYEIKGFHPYQLGLRIWV